jgi:proteasome lid subunit RPN8/RPN11
MKKKGIMVSDSLEDLIGEKNASEPPPNGISIPTNSNKNSSPPPSPNSQLGENLLSSNTDSKDFLIKKDEFIKSLKKDEVIVTPSLISSNKLGQCPSAIRIIPVTQQAFDDLIMMAKAVNEISQEKWGKDSQKMEIYCYILTDPSEIHPDHPARISEIYIPHHQATETGVEVSVDQMRDIQNYVKESGKIVLGWAHSHGHFDVFSSATDERNHRLLLDETRNMLIIDNFQLKYIYGITVVEGGDRFGIVLTQYPCGQVQRIEAEFIIDGEPYLESQRQARYNEIKQQNIERVNLVQPRYQPSNEEAFSDLAQEMLQDFVRNLWKAKNLVIDQAPDDIAMAQFQALLAEYDKKLLAGAEETFHTIAQKVMKLISKSRDLL